MGVPETVYASELTTVGLADWVGSLDHRFIPTEAISRTVTALLHYTMCGAKGQSLPTVRAVADAIPGVRVEEFAFRDAVAGHSTLQEDMHVPSQSHLGTVVWPTALALARSGGVTMGDLVAAAVAGYEMAGRAGQVLAGLGLSGRARPTGTVGPLASWAVAARLRHLDTKTSLSALSLASNTAAGLNGWAWQGGEEVFLHAGQAAAAGIRAADLAVAGIHGSPDVLLGRQGYLESWGGVQAVEDFRQLRWAGNGGDWIVEELVFKSHPGCNYIQTVVDVAETLAQGITSVDDVRVAVTTAASTYPGCDAPPPWRNRLEAQMSIQFAVAAQMHPMGYAASLAAGPSFWQQQLAELGARVTVSADPTFDEGYPEKQGASIVVRRSHGSPLVESRGDLKGLDDSGVRQALRDIADRAGARCAAEELISRVSNLNPADDAADVAQAVDQLWEAMREGLS